MSEPSARRRIRPLSWVLLFAGLAILASMAWHGWDYYRLDPAERFDHESHASLRASGFLGHGYGIAGTLLILANLLYFVRKHAGFLRGRGSLRAWMEVHVFAGLAGSGMIVFHSTFQARNHVAQAAAWSLSVLVVTGLVGRYVYALLPRSEAGDEATGAPERLRSFFVIWRALHRAFAIVMVLAMLVHVTVALYYGYSWL